MATFDKSPLVKSDYVTAQSVSIKMDDKIVTLVEALNGISSGSSDTGGDTSELEVKLNNEITRATQKEYELQDLIETNTNDIADLNEKLDNLTLTGTSITNVDVTESSTSNSVTIGIELTDSESSTISGFTDIPAATTDNAGVMTTEQVSTLYTVESDVAYIQNNIKDLTDQLTDVTSSIGTIESGIEELEEKVEDISSDVSSLKEDKQDKLIAGENITIKDGVISCTVDGEIAIVVEELPSEPEEGNEHKLHLVLNNSGENGNIYNEYLWVNSAWELMGQATLEVSLDDYYTKEDVDALIEEKQNKGDYATKDEIPKNVSELNNDTGYLVESDLSSYAKTEDIPTKISELTNDAGYLVKSDLDNYYTKDETYSKTDVDTLLSEVASGVVTSATATGDDNLTLSATVENNTLNIVGSVDLSSYATKDEIPIVPTKVSELENDSEYITEDALKDYATKDEIPTVPTNVSDFNNDSGYITEAALADYATKDEIPTIPTEVSAFNNDVGYITQAALDGYALSSEIPTKLSELENDSGYITEDNLTGYAKTEDIPTNVSQLANDSGYLVESDLSSYAKTEDITVNVASGLTSKVIWVGTEDEYNALEKDSNTIYFITESNS